MTRLTVERTFRLSSRDWLLVTGVLDGGALTIGDHVMVHDGDRQSAQTVIRSIEMHSAPGTTTIAVDLALDDLIRPGTEVLRLE
jgi:sulfate adenylyltransferase subunit 1 (EFTu-like GTPase family)